MARCGRRTSSKTRRRRSSPSIALISKPARSASLTASYQVSRMGYAELASRPARADAALLALSHWPAPQQPEFPSAKSCRRSLGPYGAALHNGAEYHGNYDCSSAELVRVPPRAHRRAGRSRQRRPPTCSRLKPALARGSLRHRRSTRSPWPDLAGLVQLHLPRRKARGPRRIPRDCAAAVARFPQTVAIGVNCTPARAGPALIGDCAQASDKPIVVYPNSGEGWDAEARCWTGSSDPESFGAQAAEWFAAGAQIVGGCCRTRPEHIRLVGSRALLKLSVTAPSAYSHFRFFQLKSTRRCSARPSCRRLA
jgi:homocysteine S-methyltransferase